MDPDSSSFQLILIAVESTPSCVFTLGKSYLVSIGFSYCANNHSVNLKKTVNLFGPWFFSLVQLHLQNSLLHRTYRSLALSDIVGFNLVRLQVVLVGSPAWFDLASDSPDFSRVWALSLRQLKKCCPVVFCGPAVWETLVISKIPSVLDSSRHSWVSQKNTPALMLSLFLPWFKKRALWFCFIELKN